MVVDGVLDRRGAAFDLLLADCRVTQRPQLGVGAGQVLLAVGEVAVLGGAALLATLDPLGGRDPVLDLAGRQGDQVVEFVSLFRHFVCPFGVAQRQGAHKARRA